MKAVFHIGTSHAWSDSFQGLPWPMLPIANRPLLDYWLESCAEQGIADIQIVLGDGAEEVEKYAGDGTAWGVNIQYGFARPNEHPLEYLRQVSTYWAEGLFFIGGPFFLRRRKAYHVSGFKKLEGCRHHVSGETYFLFGRTHDEVQALIEGAEGSVRGLEQIHIHPFPINSMAVYFELNMKLVAGEFSRYVTVGFAEKDGSSVGYNVLTPPSAHLQPPILVGNDCRFGPMTTIGGKAIVGDHVIVDSYSELSCCIILKDTYIGRNLEIRNKIVFGKLLISPDDGTTVEIDDSWVVARTRPDMRTEDLFRYVILWMMALCVTGVQLIPFCLLYPLVRLTRIAHFKQKQFHDPRTGYISLPVFEKLKNRKSVVYILFRAFCLDRFPWLLQALRSHLFVCGQPPMRHPEDDDIVGQLPRYYPGVFSYTDYNKDSDRLTDSLWYAHIRSLFEDVKILIKSLLYRFFRAGR